MSTLQKKKTTRDTDELEGTLLPPPPAAIPLDDPLRLPVATEVVEEEASPSAPPAPDTAIAAVPVEYFQYPSGREASAGDSQSAAYKQVPGADEDDIPTAPFIPTNDETTDLSRSMAEAEQLRRGQICGKILADEERSKIDKAKRDIFAKQYNEREAIRAANEEARRRDRSGVQIKEDKWFKDMEREAAYKEEDPDATKYGKKGGGYEISEYETRDYSTRDYETTEYKSVYDD